MTNINRTIIDRFSYKELYYTEIFNTGYTLVFRKTDDSSTGVVDIIGRDNENNYEGYTCVLKIQNFSAHYNTSIFTTIIDLMENFIQETNLFITSNVSPILLQYHEGHLSFVQKVLNNTTYSDMKKWCILVSVLCEASSLAKEQYHDFLFSVFDRQIHPEEIKDWDTLEQCVHYIYPTFPYSGRKPTQSLNECVNLNDFVESGFYVENSEKFIEYITIVNLLKNDDCKTLDSAKKAGFVHYGSGLDLSEVRAIRAYLNKSYLFKSSTHLTTEEILQVLKAIHSIPKIDKSLSSFVVEQALKKVVIEYEESKKQSFFLKKKEYDDFINITDPVIEKMPNVHFYIKKASDVSYMSSSYMWNFWVMMAKILHENEREVFITFFNDWMELFEEIINNYKSSLINDYFVNIDNIHRYFEMSTVEEIPVRYLWYLHEDIKS